MPVPVAVAPSVRSPGAYLSVNLLAGASTPGSGQLKVLVLATKSSVGTITPDTQLVQNVGPSEGETYFGTGTPGHLALKALFPEYGLASVDIMAPLVSGGVVASVVLTFASTPTIARTFILQIAGRQIATTWVAGVSASVFGDQVVALIAGLTSNLPVTAANITGAVTISAKYAGSWANDIVVYALLTGGSGGTVNAGQTVTTTLGSGTLSADPTNCLSVVQTREYAFILLCDGNTAALISGGTSPFFKINTHINTYNSGLNAHLQQQVLGFTGTITNANTVGGLRNAGTAELAFYQGAQSLPCEVAAAELGARLREITADPAANRIGMAYKATLYGPLDDVNDKLTAAEIESALNNGVSPIDWGSDGIPYPVRPFTTYHTDGNSNPDDRLLDTSRIDGTYAVARDIRNRLPQLYKGKKIIKALAAGQELPPNTVEEKTVRTSVTNMARYWVTQGVVKGDALEAAIANGEFIVQVDGTDASQVDIVVPVKIVPPLAKFSIVVNHVGP
jgi:phage tail sheath gpL-like